LILALGDGWGWFRLWGKNHTEKVLISFGFSFGFSHPPKFIRIADEVQIFGCTTFQYLSPVAFQPSPTGPLDQMMSLASTFPAALAKGLVRPITCRFLTMVQWWTRTMFVGL